MRVRIRFLGVVAWLITTAILWACTPPCGGLSQDCCVGGTRCGAGLACRGGGCVRSVCVQCGHARQTCCDVGPSCEIGTTCYQQECLPCGAAGQPCCGGSCAGQSVCRGGSCLACGGAGQPCCSFGCGNGLACQAYNVGGEGTCVTCGRLGDVCCPGSRCADSVECNTNGTCGQCGTPGLACCAGMRCTSPAVCIDNGSGTAVCSDCGGAGQPCCDGIHCSAPTLYCSGGSCQVCGALGLPCCAFSACPSSGVCIGGFCATGSLDGGGMAAACTATSCETTGSICLPYPSFVCSRACMRDADCTPGFGCSAGLCLPTCTPGAFDCDRYGGACFAGIAGYTSLDAPAAPGTPTCVSSCFSSSTPLPPRYPPCATGTVCDPVSGTCMTGTPGNVRLGAPCAGASDCTGVCIRSTDSSGLPTGFLGGYCVSLARNPDPTSFVPGAPLPVSNCPPGGVALPMPSSAGGDAVACYAACTNDCDCRVGYGCDHDPMRLGGAPSPNGACLPIDCAQAGVMCPPNSTCYRVGPFTHLLYSVCAAITSADAGPDAGADPGQMNTGCATWDGGVADAGIDASLDAI